MLKSLSVGRRLGLSYLAFLLPVVFLLYELVIAQNASISFAKKELVGSSYLAALRPVTAALNDPSPDAPARAARAVAALSGVETEHGAALETSRYLEALRTAVRDLETAFRSPNADKPAALSQARAALKALIRQVGDKSNLILDPDLDSYYVMEIVVVRVPELADATAELRDLVRAMAAKPTVEPRDAVALLTARAAIATAVEGIDASAAAGIRGNPDGSLGARITPELRSLVAAVGKLVAAIPERFVDTRSAVPDASAVSAAERAATAALESFGTVAQSELDRLLNKRIDGFERNRTFDLGIAGGLFVMAFVLVFRIVASGVVGPLRAAIATMRRLADGDLSTTVVEDGRGDEIGDMNRALAVFLDNARERARLAVEQERSVADTRQVASDVRINASQVAGAAGEASSAIRQIAEGVQQQAQALGQVTTALDQSVRAINEINDNAVTARNNADSLRNMSEEGLRRVAELAEVVARSAEASEQIRQITQVIDGISRKTNLLSLNAQIEAANAGEVGRGFAVVANEVQTLADNVARSAGEITRSVEQVIADVRSIGGSAEAVQEIIRNFRENARSNADLMQSVSAAVEETEATVTEINASMEQLGSVGRSNAASTEELAATMNDLASVADRMRKQVDAIA